MSAPTSAVNIVNLALDHLGQKPIASLTPPVTDEEVIAARWYDQVRRSLLREYVWNFAKERYVAPRTGTPDFDYTDAYALPNNFIRLLSIGGDWEEIQILDYDIEGRDILLNNDGSNALRIRYIKDEEDVTKFDPLFTSLLALNLALKMAYKFSLRKGLVDQINNLLAIETPKAVTVDGQERPPKRIQRSKWLRMRRYGGNIGVAGKYTITE